MDKRLLIQKALEARKNAYVPYSGYAVGAAVLTASGNIYTGCNIENAAYSPTNCGERTAIFKAVSEGEREIVAVAVVAAKKELEAPLPDFASPCGVCRQVIAEFGGSDTLIILAKSADDFIAYTLNELLPFSFTAKNL